MKENMVSVIIPVYNGEKYLRRCIESILNQSYKNVELIFIDDNATDSSRKIIEQYSVGNNIKYLHNEINRGVAQSRNIGLQYATSEYILFLDCDDWIDLNCIEKAIEKFKSDSDIDIVIWEIKTAYQHEKTSKRYEYSFDNILTSQMAINLLSHTVENEFFLSPLLGCKLFKRSLLDNNGIIFPDTIYEDDMFTYLAFLYARKIALVSGSCLYYFQHSESLTHHFTQKNVDDFFATFKQLYGYIIDDVQRESYYKYMTKSLTSMINCMISTVPDSMEQIHFKTRIFTAFYQNVKVEEYYQYSFSITI